MTHNEEVMSVCTSTCFTSETTDRISITFFVEVICWKLSGGFNFTGF